MRLPPAPGPAARDPRSRARRGVRSITPTTQADRRPTRSSSPLPHACRQRRVPGARWSRAFRCPRAPAGPRSRARDACWSPGDRRTGGGGRRAPHGRLHSGRSPRRCWWCAPRRPWWPPCRTGPCRRSGSRGRRARRRSRARCVSRETCRARGRRRARAAPAGEPAPERSRGGPKGRSGRSSSPTNYPERPPMRLESQASRRKTLPPQNPERRIPPMKVEIEYCVQ